MPATSISLFRTSQLRNICAFLALTLCLAIRPASAEPPSTAYLFPAGGQRGTTVPVRVGGYFLHEKCSFELLGPGVTAPQEIRRTETTWFEGPLIHQPASQQKEDYPKDYAGELTIAPDAPLGIRHWRVWNAQGASPARKFVVGELPEVVEQEIDGEPIPVGVAIPTTINGRIFPREDVDIWSFQAKAGQRITCVVAAAAIGSPLETRMELCDAAGKVLAATTASALEDPVLHFTVRADGTFQVRIQDARADGLQHFVYRLTITDGPWIDDAFPLGGRRGQLLPLSLNQTHGASPLTATLPLEPNAPDWGAYRLEIGGRLTNPIRLAADHLPEQVETEPNDAIEQSPSVETPVVVNGRIDRPGDRDVWSFTAKKGEPLVLEVQAARLQSPVSAVIVVRDASGKELVRGDALAGGGNDPQMAFTPPADGKYAMEVSERFASRGGSSFAYRVRMAPARPSLRLELAADAVSVDRGKEQKLVVNVIREGGFVAPITLVAENLPEGVSAAEVQVAANQNKGELVLKADAAARIAAKQVRILGKFVVNKGTVAVARAPGSVTLVGLSEPVGDKGTSEPISVTAVMPTRIGELPLDSVLVAVALPTPFKFQGQYQMTFLPCGSVVRKQYTLERGGYDGPLEIALADKQARHVQGVTGPVLVVPAGASDFTYPISLPPWMELGRTCRIVLMATGEVDDGHGGKHKVCYTTVDQNNQMVNLISPSPLKLTLDRSSLGVTAGGEAKLAVQLRRDRSVTSPARIEVLFPKHMVDLRAEPLELSPDQTAGVLTLHFGQQPGPLNMPVVIRAVVRRGDDPLVAEAKLELVAP